jgi:hypothetical protein
MRQKNQQNYEWLSKDSPSYTHLRPALVGNIVFVISSSTDPRLISFRPSLEECATQSNICETTLLYCTSNY